MPINDRTAWRSRYGWGVVPCLAMAASVLPAVETTTTGYNNVARKEAVGTLLSSPQDNDSYLTGRTTTVQYVGGWVFLGAEGPGSHKDADQEWRVYNIEDPANPIRMRPSDFEHSYPDDSWGSGNYGWNAHGSAQVGTTLFPFSRRGVETWGGTFMKNPFGNDGIMPFANGSRASAAGPWSATLLWYGSADRDFEIQKMIPDGSGDHVKTTVATFDHTGIFGGGDWHPIFFGDLLIYARSGGGDTDGIVVYRLQYSDMDDPANAAITPQFVASLNDSFKGYWPNLCSDGSGLYVMGAHTKLFKLADITAAAEPGGDDSISITGEYTQYDPRNATYPVYKDNYAFIDEFKIDITKMIAGDPDPVVLELDEDGTGVDCSQMSLTLGNIWLTGGYNTGGMGVWVHEQATDTTPPSIAYHIPQSNRENYPRFAPLSFLIPETSKKGGPVNGVDFAVRKVLSGGALGDPVDGFPVLEFSGVFTFTPEVGLDADSTYQVDFFSDPVTGVGYQDAAGNYMEAYSFRFSTGSGVAGDPPPSIDLVSASDERPTPGEQFTVTIDATVTGTAEYRFNFDGTYGDWGTADNASHSYADEGRQRVLVQVRDDSGFVSTGSLSVVVLEPPIAPFPTRSNTMAIGDDDGLRLLWVVNPDADTVAVLDADSGDKLDEITVGADPRNIARDADGRYWVSCHDADSLYLLQWNDASDAAMIYATIDLEYGDAPFGVCADADGDTIYVSYFGSDRLARFAITDTANPDVIDCVPTPRAIAVSGDGSEVYVTRFISPMHRGEVGEYASTASTFSQTRIIALDAGEEEDGGDRADGIPNYLSGIAISPDGQHALVSSKQDNNPRGEFFGLDDLTFETSVRAIVSVIDLGDDAEFDNGRRDFDNSADPSAVGFTPHGDYALVTLQGSNSLVAFDSFNKLGLPNDISAQIALDKGVGLAPQGLLVDASSSRVFVQNFMDRSVSVFDAAPLIVNNRTRLDLLATTDTVATELLSDEELLGKQIFYNAADTRMSADGYIACATCHIDGGSDGRVWDFTGRGEGLRRTTDLRGRAGVGGHGNVHWSANFDEIQDFEHDMRGPFGGTGFIDDANFATNHPDPSSVKHGLSSDLDALAAYVTSLGRESLPRSPHRDADGSLSAAGVAGQTVFESMNCISCHVDGAFTDAQAAAIDGITLSDVGTTSAFSGQRLGGGAGSLAGIDIPTLLGLHQANAYLHHGMAETLEEVFSFTGGQLYEAEEATAVWTVTNKNKSLLDENRANGWPGTVRRFYFGGEIVEIEEDREDLDNDGNLDVDEDLNDNGTLDAGEDVDGDGRLDVAEDVNGNGQLDVFESGIEIANVDGGNGGAARVTLRYAVTSDTNIIVRVNGTDHALVLERDGSRGRSNKDDIAYHAHLDISLNAGTGNSIQVLRVDRDFYLDALWVANAEVLSAADAHRQVLALDAQDQSDLMAYLRQLDGRDATGAFADELIADWSMDDESGSTVSDTAPDGTAHDGTLSGGASFVSGRLGTGVQFDGVDDQISVGNSADINTGGPYTERTISAWFKVDDIAINSRKQVIFEEGGSGRGLAIYVYDGRLYVGGWNTDTTESGWGGTYLSTDAISAGTWHQVVLTLRGRARLAAPGLIAYLDGEAFASGAGSQLWGHGGDIVIGACGGSRLHDNDTSSGHHFAGVLDEMRLYNRTLSVQQVRALYRDVASQPLPEGLDFNSVTVSGFGGNQDADPNAWEILDGGSTLRMYGNSWKQVPYDYTITADTVLSFDYQSSVEGEIQGIGLATASDTGVNDIKADTAQVYGVTTAWGGLELEGGSGYSGSGNWESFTVRLGEQMTVGTVIDRLIFINDDDRSGATPESLFRYVQLYESDTVTISAEAQLVNPSRMQVLWNDIASADYFLVRRSHADASNQIGISLLTSGSRHVFDEQLGSLTAVDYRYDVQALNSGNTVLTEHLDIAPVDMGVSQQASGSGILVDWNDIMDADWYFLQRQKSGQSNVVMGVFLPLDPSEYQDDDATEAEDPDYSVSAGGDTVLGNG